MYSASPTVPAVTVTEHTPLGPVLQLAGDTVLVGGALV
jgi:hypothetical protein